MNPNARSNCPGKFGLAWTPETELAPVTGPGAGLPAGLRRAGEVRDAVGALRGEIGSRCAAEPGAPEGQCPLRGAAARARGGRG